MICSPLFFPNRRFPIWEVFDTREVVLRIWRFVVSVDCCRLAVETVESFVDVCVQALFLLVVAAAAAL